MIIKKEKLATKTEIETSHANMNYSVPSVV